MLASKIHRDFLNELTVRDLEQLLELKKKDTKVSDLLRERDRLRLELRHVEDQIESLEREVHMSTYFSFFKIFSFSIK